MRADAETNRQAVLAAARRLMAERGPEVPLTAIATEAGVGIATLYRNFPTREDLLLGVVDDLRERVVAIVEDGLATFDEDPPAAWASVVRRMAALGIGALAARGDAAAVLGDRLGEADASRRAAVEHVDVLLARARAAGLVRDDVPADRFLAGFAAVTRPLPSTIDDWLPGQRQWIVDTYLRGLRP